MRRRSKKVIREERLKEYTQWLEGAISYRQPFEQCWNLYWSLYRHQHPFVKAANCDAFQVNKIFSTVNIMMSSTSLQHPHITITPRTAEGEIKAVVCEEMLNYLWDHHEYQQQIRKAQKDSIVIGHGWIKTVYEFEEEEYERDQAELDAEFERRLKHLHTLAPEHGRTQNEDEIRDGLETLGSRITRDCPLVERISPFDMYVDPYAKCMADARWIVQRTHVTKDEADEWAKIPLKEGGWRKDIVDKIGGGKRDDDEYESGGAALVNDDCDEWIAVYEFYDLVHETFSVFTLENTEDFLRDPEPIPYTFGHPFIYFGNYDLGEEFYDMGDVECIADLQTELNQVRTDISNQRKRFRNKGWYHEDLGEDFKKMLVSNEEDIWAPVPDDLAGNIDAIMGQVPQANVPPQFYDLSAIISNDIDEISGVTDYQRGGAAAGRTATEAAIVNAAQQARAAEKLAQVEKMMQEVAERVLMLNQQFMTAEQTIRITGVKGNIAHSYYMLNGRESSRLSQRPGSDVLFYAYGREDISGEFDVEIEAGSTQPNNEAVRAQRAIQLMTMLIPFASTGQVNVEELLRYTMEMMGVRNIDRFLQQQQQQPQPGQEGLPGNIGTPPGAGSVQPGGGPVPGVEDGQGELPAEAQLQGQVGLSIT